MNCSNHLKSDSSSSGLRCGLSYFSLPPTQRKQERMDHYPEVLPEHVCKDWSQKDTLLE
jgi:hypothetical protein